MFRATHKVGHYGHKTHTADVITFECKVPWDLQFEVNDKSKGDVSKGDESKNPKHGETEEKKGNKRSVLPPLCDSFGRHLILLLDVSGSMSPSTRILQSALATIKDMIGHDFGKGVKVSVISFSSHASLIFSHIADSKSTDDDYKKMIDELSCCGSTNLESALKTTFDLVNDHGTIPTWVFVLSDGVPNLGSLRSVDEVKEYTTAQRFNYPLVVFNTFGFGTEYKPDILDALGNYAHVDGKDSEKIHERWMVALTQMNTAFLLGMTVDVIPSSQDTLTLGENTFPVVCFSDDATVRKMILPNGRRVSRNLPTFQLIVRARRVNGDPFEMKIDVDEMDQPSDPKNVTLEFVVDYFRLRVSKFLSQVVSYKMNTGHLYIKEIKEMFNKFIEERDYTKDHLKRYTDGSEISLDTAFQQIQESISQVRAAIDALEKNNASQLLSAYSGVRGSSASAYTPSVPTASLALMKTISDQNDQKYFMLGDLSSI